MKAHKLLFLISMDILTVLLIFLVLIFLLYISTGESNGIQNTQQSINSTDLEQKAVTPSFEPMTNQKILNYLSEQQKNYNTHRWSDNDILKGINVMRNLHKLTNTNKRDISNPKQYLQTTAQSIQTKSDSEIKGGEKTHFNNALNTFNNNLSYTQPNLLLLTALTINYFIKHNLSIPYVFNTRHYTAEGSRGLVYIFVELGKSKRGCVDDLLSRLLLQQSLLSHVIKELTQDNKHSPSPQEEGERLSVTQ